MRWIIHTQTLTWFKSISPVNISSIKYAAEIVNSGGVIAYPTEYCYGFGCNPRNIQAVRRILRIKRRPRYKGLILISDRYQRLHRYVSGLPDLYREEIFKSWPGECTWLLPAKRSVSRWIRGHHASVAARITANKSMRILCSESGIALISTSANRSGRSMLRSYLSVKREFFKEVDYILPGSVGNAKGPSMIRDSHTGILVRGKKIL